MERRENLQPTTEEQRSGRGTVRRQGAGQERVEAAKLLSVRSGSVRGECVFVCEWMALAESGVIPSCVQSVTGSSADRSRPNR